VSTVPPPVSRSPGALPGRRPATVAQVAAACDGDGAPGPRTGAPTADRLVLVPPGEVRYAEADGNTSG